MNTKTLNIIFALIAVLTSAFAIYAWNRMRQLEEETENWKAKYEEAIIDAEEAVERIEKMEKELEAALQMAEQQRQQALEALEKSQKSKTGR